MRTRLITWAVAAAVLLSAVSAAAQHSVPRADGGPALFRADSVDHDQSKGRVQATGNVEITQGPRILRADRVTFTTATGVATASGNVQLVEPSGDVLFAEQMELTDDLREGFIRNLRVRLADDSLFAAASARRSGGNRTEMKKAVYTPCKVCKDKPDTPPLWRLRAYEIVHHQDAADVEYYDAFLDMFGIPVLYLPYLSHPDPTVKRRTGILAPRWGSDSELGLLVQTPYYFNISPNQDATFSPIITGNEGVVLAGEYRRRFTDGELKLESSITRASAEKGGTATRGHIDLSTKFDLDDTWRTGLKLQRATDDTYMRRYGFTTPDALLTHAFVEGFRGRSYAAANAYTYQPLRGDENQGRSPIVAPMLDYNYLSEPGEHGGRWSIDGNMMVLTRTDGTDSRRLSLKTGWQLPHTSPAGELYTLYASLQTDGYWADEVTDPLSPDGADVEGVHGRIFPQIGLDWRLPLARHESSVRQVITPVAGLVLAPNGGNPDKVPNEDSQDLELDDTNIFSANRFNGLDRVEGGQRLYYGVNFSVYGAKAGKSSLFFGQSYRFRNDATFALNSGLEEKLSDYVGRVNIAPALPARISYRFRLDNGNLNLRRSEASASIGPKALTLNINHFMIDRQALGQEFDDREELTIGLRSQITDLWSGSITTRQDLSSDGGSLQHTFGAKYEDECFIFTVNFSRSFTSDRDASATDQVFFRLSFKHLGEIASAL